VKIKQNILSLWQKWFIKNYLWLRKKSQFRALLIAIVVELLVILWLSLTHIPNPPHELRMEINFQSEKFDFDQLKPPLPQKIPDISKYLNNQLSTLASNEWQDEYWTTESRGFETENTNTFNNSNNNSNGDEDEDNNDDDQGPITPPKLKPALLHSDNKSNNPTQLIKEKSFKGASRIIYYVRGRWKIALSNPIYTCPDDMHGWITVNIQVNRQGHVVHAQYDPKRSTSSKECLIDAAIRYARRTRFNRDPNAPPLSYGYIKYLF